MNFIVVPARFQVACLLAKHALGQIKKPIDNVIEKKFSQATVPTDKLIQKELKRPQKLMSKRIQKCGGVVSYYGVSAIKKKGKLIMHLLMRLEMGRLSNQMFVLFAEKRGV